MTVSADRLIKGFLTLVAVGAVGATIWYLFDVVLYIIIAAILSLVGHPLVVRLTRLNIGKRSISRAVAAALTLVVMWLVVGVLCWLFIPLISGKVQELASMDWASVTATVESSLQHVEAMLERLFAVEITDIGETFKNFMLSIVDIDVVETFSSLLSVLSSVAISFFSISFITYYFCN